MQRIIEFDLPVNPINPFPEINWYEFAKEMLSHYNPDSHSCQRCHKRIWSAGIATYYPRRFVWPCNGKKREDWLYIPVVLCEACGRSDEPGIIDRGDYYHAILGGIIVPFTKYSLPFILTVLDSYVNRTGTVEDVCEQWGICRNTLYSWRDRYIEQYNSWADSLHQLEAFDQALREQHPTARDISDRVLAIALGLVNCLIQTMTREFFVRFAYSFMQPSKKTHLRELPRARRP